VPLTTPVLRVAALAICLAWWPQGAVFKSGIEAVRVDALVTRDGRPVTGLTPADFDVLDNGVPQRLDTASFEEVPLNVVLVLDASGSVEGTRAEHLRTASRAVLERLKPGEHAALVSFTESVVVTGGFSGDLRTVKAAIGQGVPLSETSLVDAASAALLVAESQPGRSLVLVFTDGLEVSSYLDADAVLESTRRSEAVVYGVGLSSIPRPPFLRDLAATTGGELLEIESSAELDATFTRILDQFRHRYLFSYTPTGVERKGWHKLTVRARQERVSVKARAGYLRD
jgi:Ca-activated chloride channel homolog